MGMEQDKGVAVRTVIDIFKSNSAEELTTIGLGDSENDLPMFEQVDIPVRYPVLVRVILMFICLE